MSQKLGISSLLLLVAFVISPFQIGSWPFGWVFGIVACLLGWGASRSGSKWWRAVPILLIAFTVFFAAMLLHPE